MSRISECIDEFEQAQLNTGQMFFILLSLIPMCFLFPTWLVAKFIYEPWVEKLSKMREDLYRNLKLVSAAEGKPLQTLLEEAVMQYLDNRKFSEKPISQVKEDSAPYGRRYTVSFDIVKENEEEKSEE